MTANNDETKAPTGTLGERLYREMVGELQYERESARVVMVQAAMTYANSNKDIDRTNFLVAKTWHDTTDRALNVVLKRAGDLSRLDVT